MSNPAIFTEVKEAEDFSRVWKYKGLAVPLTEVHHQFASDFANIVLSSFIRMSQEYAAQSKEVEADR